MPPNKPASKILISLMPMKSRIRQAAERRREQEHTSNDIFDMVLGRAMVTTGVIQNGSQVQLNMSQYELEELKKNYNNILREEIRKRLTRDTDYDKKRFPCSQQVFMKKK